MKIGHILRKYNPDEWGGTETSLKNLCEGLLREHLEMTIFYPKIANQLKPDDSFRQMGCKLVEFNAVVPVWNITEKQKSSFISVGGNLLSFDLPWLLWNEPQLSLIHSHTLNRLGAIGYWIAKIRKIPFVVSIHGGFFDLPDEMKKNFQDQVKNGIDWGKCFGFFLKSRKLLDHADAIITSNQKEASFLKEKYPQKNIIIQHHGVDYDRFQEDYSEWAKRAFPQIINKKILLNVGRIDPQKNQSWIISQMPAILKKHPDVVLVLVGSTTNEQYENVLKKQIEELELQDAVFFLGNIPQGDKRLIGLYQQAKAFILPSIVESFGITILEAWAAGTPVISSMTAGAQDLIKHGENGYLFDLKDPDSFLKAIDEVLEGNVPKALIDTGKNLAKTKYNTEVIAQQTKELYDSLTRFLSME